MAPVDGDRGCRRDRSSPVQATTKAQVADSDEAPWRPSCAPTWLPNDRSAELARDHRHHSSRTYVPHRGVQGFICPPIGPNCPDGPPMCSSGCAPRRLRSP